MLTPGVRFGPYEIQSLVGAGGMGEVYRARDTRLDRAVAIKILPAHLAADPQLRERFDHEARAVSALDHPHICPLYDLGEHDGTSFLVMQYLEGETLDARLSRGALPLDQALLYGMQIADALDKAHRAGIVHRDLKPGNVMLTKAGAKLLDFGLAKSMAPSSGVAGLSMLPTTPPGLTAQGSILGTFQYMAPEQLEGREADPRTDIFAFGAVLFEMLTARKAFEGKSQASLIGAILKDDPPPPSTLQPLAPRALDRLVKTCLAKDPDERWQSARDLHRELAWIADSGLHASPAEGAGTLVRQRQTAWLVAAVFAVAFAVSLGMLMWDRIARRADGDLTVVRFTVPTESNRAATDYFSGGLALSPDGQTLAYVDGVAPTYKLLVRSVDSLESRTLATGESIHDPFWSPDGRFVAFFSRGDRSVGGSVLRHVEVADGTTQTVCAIQRPAPINGGTWGLDGVILFSGGGLFRCSPSGGEAVAIAVGPRVFVRWPQFLPGQNRVLYFSYGAPGSPQNGVYLATLEGGALTNSVKVMSSEYPAQYVAPGYLLFVRDGVLLAQRFNADTASLQGDSISLAPRVAVSPDVNLRRADFSAAGGRVAYRSTRSLSRLTWLDRKGNEQGVVGEPDEYAEADLSPDGTQIVVETNENGFGEVWVMSAERGTRIPITRTPDVWEYSPRWSPDGRRVAFSVARGETNTIDQKLADGSGAQETLTSIAPFELVFPRHWMRDGILFMTLRGGLFRVSASPNSKAAPLPGSGAGELNGRVSPDGRWIAYTTAESGRNEVFVRPLNGGAKTPVSIAGGAHPHWHRNGTELYFQAPDGSIMASTTRLADRFEAGVPTRLFSMRSAPDDVRQSFSTIDGQRFLVRVHDAGTPPSISWLVNWPALTSRR